MSFSLKSFCTPLLYVSWKFPFLGNGIICSINNHRFMIGAKVTFYWLSLCELIPINGNSLFIIRKENSSIFNVVLG
ncbi:hypothetical protein DHD05_16460 [Arenibacter sp. N53]|nr:hypothetical protein [Arenibacter sp. N53]